MSARRGKKGRGKNRHLARVLRGKKNLMTSVLSFFSDFFSFRLKKDEMC